MNSFPFPSSLRQGVPCRHYNAELSEADRVQNHPTHSILVQSKCVRLTHSTPPPAESQCEKALATKDENRKWKIGTRKAKRGSLVGPRAALLGMTILVGLSAGATSARGQAGGGGGR